MPRIITLHEKLSVIDAWLRGESRKDIAIKHNIGSGTVYNIVQEWSSRIGYQLADRLRELGIKLKKNGLTVSDCAKGLRMLMMLRKYGIQDDENQEKIPYFLNEIYAKCKEVGLTTQQVFDYISDILKFSSEIPISEIPKFMKKRTEDKEHLERNIEELSKNTTKLTELKEEQEREIQRLKNIKETMTKTYRKFTIVKYQLKPYGIEMDNIEQFVQCVVGVSKENYDPVQILKKIGNYETLEKQAMNYKAEVDRKKNELTKLNQDIDTLNNTLGYLKIKVDMLNDLEARGFGIKEFRILISMFNEIGLENKQEFEETKKEFFEDVKNYEEVIGSRKEIERLKNEHKKLEVQIIKEREKFNAYPKVIESIIRLAGAGISEEDIVKLDRILSMTDFYSHKDNSLYKDALFDDLQKYKNLKLAIKNLDTEIHLKSIKKTRDKPTMKKSSKRYKTKNKESVA